MSSMIERIKNYKCTIKNILSFILYSILFWLLIGYIVLPICNTFIQAFQSKVHILLMFSKNIFQIAII